MGISKADRSFEKLYPFGYTVEEDRLYFCTAAEGSSLSLHLYKDGRSFKRIAFSEEDRIGNVWRLVLCGVPLDGSFSYTYEAEGKETPEPYAAELTGRESYGSRKNLRLVPRAVIRKELSGGGAFCDIKREGQPSLSLENSLIYRLHVRGFTKDQSSGVDEKRRGTFYGVIDKLPYLKELGVTSVELMPAYEYNETELSFDRKGIKINYWGFTEDAERMAPKASFGGTKGFREMTEALHKEGMELILGIYFSGNEPEDYVMDVIRHWRLSYGVDGVHIVGMAPLKLLLNDPYLKGMKLFADNISPEDTRRRKRDQAFMPVRKDIRKDRIAAVCNDDFQNSMRRFIKGDESMVDIAMGLIRPEQEEIGRVNYMANVSGFSLWDVYSYDRKHNKENGEHDTDGTDYNYSWNCGEQGPSRKKRINDLRLQLCKAALLMAIISGGTPLINAGDEMGHTRKGNNNSWCMDNKLEWIDWGDLEKHKELYEFTKALIRLRKDHPILRQRSFKGSDYKATGLPDISFHGKSAWKVDHENYRRQLGVCFNGDYAEKAEGVPDDSFYVGMNMHWEPHKFYLPKLKEGKRWHMLLDTSVSGRAIDEDELTELKFEDSVRIAPRSIIILIGK